MLRRQKVVDNDQRCHLPTQQIDHLIFDANFASLICFEYFLKMIIVIYLHVSGFRFGIMFYDPFVTSWIWILVLNENNCIFSYWNNYNHLIDFALCILSIWYLFSIYLWRVCFVYVTWCLCIEFVCLFSNILLLSIANVSYRKQKICSKTIIKTDWIIKKMYLSLHNYLLIPVRHLWMCI